MRAIGLDLVEIERIERAVKRFGDRFVDRILSPRERDVYTTRRSSAQFLAGRFAAKEAAIKALGAFLTDRPGLSKIEVINDDTGMPALHLPAEVKAQLAGHHCLVSITHERRTAAAVVVIMEDGPG